MRVVEEADLVSDVSDFGVARGVADLSEVWGSWFGEGCSSPWGDFFNMLSPIFLYRGGLGIGGGSSWGD